MSDYDRGFEEGLAEGLGIREVLTSTERPPSVPVAGPDSPGGQWTAENLPDELTAVLDELAGREHSTTGSVRSSLAAILNRYDEMLSLSTQTPASDHLGSCGHELDRWETHLEHHPECPADGSPCTCPEVCAACCGECE